MDETAAVVDEPEAPPKLELVKKAPPYLYEGCYKLILGYEYCFRSTCTCPWEAQCKREKVKVDVAQDPNIRRAFIARPGYIYADIDYSGVELRLAANFSLEPVWVGAFQKGFDLQTCRLGVGRLLLI